MQLHVVAVATIHPIIHGATKVILFFDANMLPLDKDENSLSKVIRNQHLVEFLLFKVYEQKNARVPYFINCTRPEHNTGGDCLVLALEWLVELAVYGFDFTRIQREM
jgi:hypothetical protein